MTQEADAIRQAIEELIEGPTGRREEAKILELLGGASAPVLNQVLLQLDQQALTSSLDDRLLGPDNRSALFNLLTEQRLTDLGVETRLRLVNTLQKGPTRGLEEEALRNIFVGSKGSDLTALKNGVDRGRDYRDLQQLIFTDIDRDPLRREILDHIQSEAPTQPTANRIKALSDVDDTLYASLNDRRYPRGKTYPGVTEFYRQLLRGSSHAAGAGGDLVFLTARPKIRTGNIEDLTHFQLRERGVGQATILSGDFLHLIGSEAIAQRKFENFVQYQQLFPEYGFVFIGDSGQGDALFGERILGDFPHRVRAVVIHDVASTPPDQRQQWRNKGVVLFDT